MNDIKNDLIKREGSIEALVQEWIAEETLLMLNRLCALVRDMKTLPDDNEAEDDE